MGRHARGNVPAEPIGSLSERMTAVAGRVFAKLASGDRVVYAADDGLVYVADLEAVHRVPAHWVAGTFRLGAEFKSVVDDLRCLRDCRRRDWMLD